MAELPRPTAPEGWRTPRRYRANRRFKTHGSVLECGGPPPLWRGSPVSWLEFTAPVLFILLATAPTSHAASLISPVLTPAAAPAGHVQIEGVEAGPFDPRLWQTNAPPLVPDWRFPILTPLDGAFRNIYAPSAVETPSGYRVFYGAWDGIPTANDRLYSLTTDPQFQTAANRHTVVLPGEFIHVCNVNALRFDDGSFAMFGTVYPVGGLNKPAFFRSDATGTNWNSTSGEPHTVVPTDLVSLAGYSANADINGMNVMLWENGQYRLYFGDFNNFAGVHRASSTNGAAFTYEAQVLSGGYAVNDVKNFRVGATNWYLMGLHLNSDRLWYALSTNGLSFPAPKTLLTNRNSDDRYIVALGWVTRGAATETGRKLLGVLYGAGPVASLDQNRIFARWLQKRVVFATDGGARFAGTNALGPDRQLVGLPAGPVTGRFELYAEDGTTLIGKSPPVTINAGQTYRLLLDALPIPRLFNTGVSDAVTLLGTNTADPHYTLAASADAGHLGPAALTVNEVWPLAPAGPWVSTGPESVWLAPRANQSLGNAPGEYLYRTTFDLTGHNPATASITGHVAVDDLLTDVRLNGQSLGVTAAGFGDFTAFTIPVGSPFVTGTNTLDFVVLNGGAANNPTGLRVEMTGAVAPNDAPFAGSDVAFVHGNFTSSLNVSNLLANDTDADSDALTITVVEPGTNTASVELTNNTVRFTPPTGFGGNAAFSYIVSDGRGGQATGAVAVVVVKPEITGWTVLASNALRLEFHGLPLTDYRLQAATNLGSWFELATNRTASDGSLQVEDAAALNTPSRFYRFAWP